MADDPRDEAEPDLTSEETFGRTDRYANTDEEDAGYGQEAEEPERPPRPPEERGEVPTEGGRGVPLGEGPENAMMRVGTITTSETTAISPDLSREEQFEEIDREAAGQARMDVRRHEHSSD